MRIWPAFNPMVSDDEIDLIITFHRVKFPDLITLFLVHALLSSRACTENKVIRSGNKSGSRELHSTAKVIYDGQLFLKYMCIKYSLLYYMRNKFCEDLLKATDMCIKMAAYWTKVNFLFCNRLDKKKKNCKTQNYFVICY